MKRACPELYCIQAKRIFDIRFSINYDSFCNIIAKQNIHMVKNKKLIFYRKYLELLIFNLPINNRKCWTFYHFLSPPFSHSFCILKNYCWQFFCRTRSHRHLLDPVAYLNHPGIQLERTKTLKIGPTVLGVQS